MSDRSRSLYQCSVNVLHRLLIIACTIVQVEMWLVAPEELYVAGGEIHISKGERLLMEVSRKFTQQRLRSMAFSAGWCWQVCGAALQLPCAAMMLHALEFSASCEYGVNVGHEPRLSHCCAASLDDPAFAGAIYFWMTCTLLPAFGVTQN